MTIQARLNAFVDQSEWNQMLNKEWHPFEDFILSRIDSAVDRVNLMDLDKTSKQLGDIIDTDDICGTINITITFSIPWPNQYFSTFLETLPMSLKVVEAHVFAHFVKTTIVKPIESALLAFLPRAFALSADNYDFVFTMRDYAHECFYNLIMTPEYEDVTIQHINQLADDILLEAQVYQV